MSSRHPNDPLSGLLSEWRVSPAHRPQFRSQVWTRVESRAGQQANWSLFARSHAGLVAAVVTASILVGAWSGQTEAREHRDADRQAIAASYVHTLDARWMRHP